MAQNRSIPEMWLENFYAAGDALDPKPWISEYCTENAHLQFADLSVAIRMEEIEAFFTARFNWLHRLKHNIPSVDVL